MTAADTRPLLDEALAQVDGYQAAADAIAAAQALTLPLRTLADVETEIREDTADAMTAGDVGVLDGYGARLEEARETIAAEVRAANDRRALVVTLEGRLAALLRDDADPAFAHLTGVLDVLLDDLADVDRTLGPIRTADAVLDDGTPDVVAAWRRLDELVTRYDQIREAQTALYKTVGYLPPDGRALRDIIEDAGLFQGHRVTRGAGWWPTGDAGRPSHLRAVVRNRETWRPWVPTPNELTAHVHALDAGRKPAPDPDREREIERTARDQRKQLEVTAAVARDRAERDALAAARD